MILRATHEEAGCFSYPRQTHGAAPRTGIDPIVTAAQIVLALQTVVSRRVDVTAEPAVVTVGTFQSGTRHNIIPDDATLTGTIRTFDPATTARVQQQIRDIATPVAAAAGATADVRIDEGAAVTFNDARLAAQMRTTLERVFGATNVLESRG